MTEDGADLMISMSQAIDPIDLTLCSVMSCLTVIRADVHVQFADTGKTLKHVKLVMTFYRCRSADIQWYRIQGLYRFS